MFRYALPSLKVQKKEMGLQAAKLLGRETKLSDYIEIGTTGRYVKSLRKHLTLSGSVTLVHDKAPTRGCKPEPPKIPLGRLGAAAQSDDCYNGNCSALSFFLVIDINYLNMDSSQ